MCTKELSVRREPTWESVIELGRLDVDENSDGADL